MTIYDNLTEEIVISNNDGFTLFKTYQFTNKHGFCVMGSLLSGQGGISLLYALFICLPMYALNFHKHCSIRDYIRGV